MYLDEVDKLHGRGVTGDLVIAREKDVDVDLSRQRGQQRFRDD